MVILNRIKFSIYVVLTFMFIFGFKIYGPLNAAMLSSVLIFILLTLNKISLNNFFKLIKSKFFIFIFISYVIFLLLIILFPIFHDTYDFTMIRSSINNIISLFVSAALVSLVYSKYKNFEISTFLVITLIAQSLFIITMIILPDIREIILPLIQTEEQLTKMSIYGGIRGVALSNSVAFGLSIIMGLLGFIMHYWFCTVGYNIKKIYKFFIFIITLVASLSAGRSSFLGFILGFYLYIFFYPIYIQVKSYFQYMLIMIIFVLLFGMLSINLNDNLSLIFYKYSSYVFQSFINYFETGHFSNSSLDSLSHMYFYPPNDNIIFGDGYYTSQSGSYYMHTDAGYMRNILFFGLFGMSILFGLWFLLFYYSIIKFDLNFRYLLIGFLLMSLIYHYKGDVIFWNVGFMKIITLMILFEYLKKQNFRTTHEK